MAAEASADACDAKSAGWSDVAALSCASRKRSAGRYAHRLSISSGVAFCRYGKVVAGVSRSDSVVYCCGVCC